MIWGLTTDEASGFDTSDATDGCGYVSAEDQTILPGSATWAVLGWGLPVRGPRPPPVAS